MHGCIGESIVGGFVGWHTETPEGASLCDSNGQGTETAALNAHPIPRAFVDAQTLTAHSPLPCLHCTGLLPVSVGSTSHWELPCHCWSLRARCHHAGTQHCADGGRGEACS